MGAAVESGVETRLATRRWHNLALNIFMVIVIMHWSEHIVQAYQIYALEWPMKKAGGIVGLWYPWLISSEFMHYGYALVMLGFLWSLRLGFSRRSRQWWILAFALQFWHHIEHLLLFVQASVHQNIAGSPVPSSILQFFVPRVELHLFYNTIVTIPMVVAVVLHVRSRPRAMGHQA